MRSVLISRPVVKFQSPNDRSVTISVQRQWRRFHQDMLRPREVLTLLIVKLTTSSEREEENKRMMKVLESASQYFEGFSGGCSLHLHQIIRRATKPLHVAAQAVIQPSSYFSRVVMQEAQREYRAKRARCLVAEMGGQECSMS